MPGDEGKDEKEITKETKVFRESMRDVARGADAGFVTAHNEQASRMGSGLSASGKAYMAETTGISLDQFHSLLKEALPEHFATGKSKTSNLDKMSSNDIMRKIAEASVSDPNFMDKLQARATELGLTALEGRASVLARTMGKQLKKSQRDAMIGWARALEGQGRKNLYTGYVEGGMGGGGGTS